MLMWCTGHRQPEVYWHASDDTTAPLHGNVTPASLFLTLLLSCTVWNMGMMTAAFSVFIRSWRHVEQLGDLGKAFRRSPGKGATCPAAFTGCVGLSSALLWVYLYAWPGISPGRWLDTGWQRPPRPRLLRSGRGRCRAAPGRWDLRRRKGGCYEVKKRGAEEQQKAGKTAQWEWGGRTICRPLLL